MTNETRTMPAKPGSANAVDYFRAKLTFEATPHTLKSNMERGAVQVVDVRDKESFEKEHIRGAVNIPLDELPSRFNTLPKDKTVVSYCWSLTCALAPKAALQLAEKGYKVQMLAGGIAEWKKAFPSEIEQGAAESKTGTPSSESSPRSST